MEVTITPRTKVGELLARYPELEDVLIAQAPQFAKLRNPILRRTVAKVATLQAAAATAGVDVMQLVRTLRAAAGQDPDLPPDAPAAHADQVRPEWADAGDITATLDIDDLLNRGCHPLAEVKRVLREAAPGQRVVLVSGFRPQPLIDTLQSTSLRIFSEPAADGRWTTTISPTDH